MRRATLLAALLSVLALSGCDVHVYEDGSYRLGPVHGCLSGQPCDS